jgi:hypothetical protein
MIEIRFEGGGDTPAAYSYANGRSLSRRAVGDVVRQTSYPAGREEGTPNGVRRKAGEGRCLALE